MRAAQAHESASGFLRGSGRALVVAPSPGPSPRLGPRRAGPGEATASAWLGVFGAHMPKGKSPDRRGPSGEPGPSSPSGPAGREVPPVGPASMGPPGPLRSLGMWGVELTPARTLADRLGVSVEAVELTRAVELVDLHVDALIPVRLFGYDVRVRHGRLPFLGYGFGHFDVPRALDGGLSGAMWSVTTNPFRSRMGRFRTFLKNVERFRGIVAASSGTLRIARSLAEYRAARAQGAIACLLAVQGANCLDADLVSPKDVPERLLTRATLMHLTNSRIGASSGPWARLRRHKGLTARGRALVEALDAERIFVDLAHAHPDSFWDAVDAHDRALPLIATHTGVKGVHPVWRNLDDDQLRAIADTGGVIGVIFSSYFLVPRGRKDTGRMVVEHMEHALRVAGEEHVALGSDFDGFIIPPPDLRSADTYPRLTQHMMSAGWSTGRIERVLGGNFLRAFGEMRPD